MRLSVRIENISIEICDEIVQDVLLDQTFHKKAGHRSLNLDLRRAFVVINVLDAIT